MAEYKKYNRAGGNSPRPFTKNAYPSKEVFDAECNSCHARCQVPFRPNGKKPVYCANCYTKSDNASSARPSFRGGESRSFGPQRSAAPDVSDRQIQELKKEIATMNVTLQHLVTAVDTFNRATALTLEIQKHFPAPTVEKEKKAETKKVSAKTTKAVSKKK
jgi:CxxC-x17-CxxC domain-containing protein